jgi:hypothetical protein
VGLAVSVGLALGLLDGMGEYPSSKVGSGVKRVGIDDGRLEGRVDGLAEGAPEGGVDGTFDGVVVGVTVGAPVGYTLGANDG